MALKKLADLQPGEGGIIKHITGTGLFFNRLRSLGLRQEASLLVTKCAPLGDPIEIRVKGHHLALRRREASHILLVVA